MSIFAITDIDIVYINNLSLKDKLLMKQCNKYYNGIINDVVIQEYNKFTQKNKKMNKCEMFHKICEDGLFNLAKYWQSYYDMSDLYSFPYTNNIELMKWLYNIYKVDDYVLDKLLFISCKNGDLEIAKWLYSKFKYISKDIMNGIIYTICQNGHVDIAKWLCENYTIYDAVIFDIFILTISNGYQTNNKLEILKLLFSFDAIPKTKDKIFGYYERCCYNGNLEILKWLNIDYKIDNKDINYLLSFCTRGDKDMINWLKSIKN